MQEPQPFGPNTPWWAYILVPVSLFLGIFFMDWLLGYGLFK